MKRLLITGVPRSGTTYTAIVLRHLGLRCGHEQAYDLSHHGRWADLDAEVSWLAVPYAQDAEARVFHQVRDPLHVTRSFQGFGFVTRDTLYTQFAAEHAPEAFEPDDPLTRCVALWTVWNERSEVAAELTYRVESLDAELLHELVGEPLLETRVEQALKVSKLSNHRVRDESVQWEDLLRAAGPWTDRFLACCERYGYPTDRESIHGTSY